MKQIVKIKSITDVITNSSSEVYIMNEADAFYLNGIPGTCGCISIEKIDWDWLKQNSWEYDNICDICDLDYSELEKENSWYPENNTWEHFIEKHKDVFEEKLIKPNYYWVDIEDHFGYEEDENGDRLFDEVTNHARRSSIFVDSRH